MPIVPNQPAAITRYFPPEITRVLFCPSIANTAAPTFAELSAGTELTRDWADWKGWTTSTAFLKTPGILTRFVGQIPGRIEAADSSITFYADKLSADVRTLLPQDTAGFIVIADGGLTSGKGDVFPVTVASNVMVRDAEAPGKIMIEFAITSVPKQNVVLPQS